MVSITHKPSLESDLQSSTKKSKTMYQSTKLPEIKTPIYTDSWNELAQHMSLNPFSLRQELFINAQYRLQHYNITLDSENNSSSSSSPIDLPLSFLIHFDYSKAEIDDKIKKLLFKFAREMNIEQWRDAMLSGKHVNITEDRPALHTALRANKSFLLNGIDINEDVQEQLNKVKEISKDIREGKWLGATGKSIKDVISIGIGGSDLGPAMATLALSHGKQPVTVQYVSNVDGVELRRAIQCVQSLESTVFIIVSKTFTTAETMLNAESAKKLILDMLLKKNKDPLLISRHFIAVSSNVQEISRFGIETKVHFWDWVGGRFSVWSAVGLGLAVAIGPEAFQEMLDGAHLMDEHFAHAPLEQNIPVMLALLDVWYRSFLEYKTHAIIPYEQALARFPAYLQQLMMESNGKGVQRRNPNHDPSKVPYNNNPTEDTEIDETTKDLCWDTCPVIWGEPGTNGQHAFFQLLHQGTDIVPCDFLVGLEPADGQVPDLHHHHLVANCFAQSSALAFGRPQPGQPLVSEEETVDQIRARMADPEYYRRFTGNRPSSTILYPRLTAKVLGALIAMYEHQVAVQGFLWNINSFDQFGVELGKVLAKDNLNLINEIKGDQEKVDPYARSLLTKYLGYNNKWNQQV